MAAPSVTNTFVAGTTAKATEVNQNFTDVINGITDGTKDLTISALAVGGAATFATTIAVTGEATLTGGTAAFTANGHITLAAGADLLLSSTSDITVNTNKFTVAGATGNTLIAGTLEVTGAIIQTSTLAAAGTITLGAGADLVGSATSDITFNTNKFTVAGATGNTVIAGTAGITGVLTCTTTLSAATGSTIGNLTLANGSITDSSGAISFGNENLSTTGTLGVGTASPDGTFHAHEGSAGAVTANVIADTGVFENNAAAGITILTPDASDSNFAFGSPTASIGALFRWNYDGGDFEIKTVKAAAQIILSTGAATVALTIDGNQAATFAGTLGSGAITSTGAIADGAASTFTTGTTIGNLTLANGSITDSGGTVSFGDEIITTTGNIESVGGSVTGDTIASSGTVACPINAGMTVNNVKGAYDFIVHGDDVDDLIKVDGANDDVTIGGATPVITVSGNDSKLGFFNTAAVTQLAKADYNNWTDFGDVVDALVVIGLFDAA